MKPLDSRSRIVGLTLAAAALLILPAVLPDKAGAATQLGQVSPADPPSVSSGNLAQFDTAAVPYQVPPAGGVITGWSHRGASGAAGSGRLQVWRDVGSDQFTLIGRSAVQSFASGVVNFFSTRVPVSGGELLGLRGDNAAGIYGGASGDVAIALSGADPVPGNTRGIAGVGPSTLVNVSAVLEPDADGDEFGDESQDECPGQAGSADGCPPAQPGPLGSLTLDLAAKKQKLKQSLVVFATASADSTLVVKGKAIVKTTKRLKAKQRTKVRVKVKRAARKALAKKLDKSGKATIKTKATTTDQSGATATDTVRVKLKA